MWFLFGFITLISFSIYFGYQRYQAGWDGTEGSVGGINYKYKIATHKGRVVKLLVGCDAIENISFSIKKEKWWDRLFKTVGISVEHQVDAKEFDREFYLLLDNESLCNLFSESFELQDLVEETNESCKAHKIKFKKLHCRHGRIWLDLVPEKKSERPDISVIAKVLVPGLDRISEILKDKQDLVLDKKNDPFILKAIVILAISTGLAVNACIQLFRIAFIEVPFIVDNGPLFYASLPYGLAIIGTLIIVTLILLGRTARTHLVLIELILIGSFGAISTSYLSLRDINIDLDVSPPEYYPVTVYNKRISRSKNSTSYYLKIDDWNNKSGRKEIKVSSDIYDRFSKNQIARIVQMHGYLGHLWVADVIN